MSALRRLRQEDHEFEASLSYLVSQFYCLCDQVPEQNNLQGRKIYFSSVSVDSGHNPWLG
jgi:hypothetical protein